LKNNQTQFSSKVGFILASAGSAVGLGNIWRFPHLAAEHGGGIFLLTYIILAITFGFCLTVTEIAIGRKTGAGVLNAFQKLDKRFAFIGVITFFIPLLILPYYSVVGGWVLHYGYMFISGQGTITAEQDYFSNFISQPGMPILFLAIFIALTAVIVMLGVKRGIELTCKIFLPILVLMTIGIAIYGMTLPGALEGLKYYLLPDFSGFSFKTVLAALGQLFYSMSLAMGITLTYGAYMKKDTNIENSTFTIGIFDTGIAFFSGLMIIPAIFALSPGGSTEINSGTGLMFTTMPQVFTVMPGGQIVGTIFFVLVFLAAITSSIGLMEAIVASIQDKFGWKRIPICIGILLFCLTLGTCSSLGFGVWDSIQLFGMTLFDMFDFLTNSILMPIVALCTCIFIGFFLKPKSMIDEVQSTAPFRLKSMYSIFIKWLAPVCIVAILVTAFLQTAGVITL